MKIKIESDLIVINVIIIVLIIVIKFFPLAVLSGVLGLPAILFFPGYAMMAAFFPGKTHLGGWERMALSLGLSIAVVPLISLVLNYTPWGIRLYPVLLSLWVFVSAMSLIAAYRRRRVAHEERFSFLKPRPLSIDGLPRLLGTTFRRLAMSEQAKLFLVLALGYWLVFMPHSGYLYPLHADEWLHLAYSRAIQVAGSTTVSTVPLYEFPNFVSGTIETAAGDTEVAFHLLWANLQEVTGISWLTIFRYFPGVIFLFTIVSVYVFARREGYGLEAAFLTSLIPTNVTMLGPSFLVPLALGMMFLPLSLLLIFNHRMVVSYIVLLIFISFLLLMHPPTAVILTIVFLFFAAISVARDLKHSLAIAAAIVIPYLAIFPGVLQIAPGIVKSLTEPASLPPYLPYLPQLFYLWGYLPTFLFVIGVFLLARSGKLQGYSLILACLFLLLHNSVFAVWHLGAQIMYHRSPIYLMLLMSIIGGYGLWMLRNLSLPDKLRARFKVRLLSQHMLRLVLVGILIALIVWQTVTIHAETPFYRMIDQEDYHAFVWIENNLPDSYRKAILDPWKATAFMALARREVYTRIQHAPGETDFMAYEFLGTGCTDTDFLKDNSISIVYSRDEVRNSDLIQVRKNVYILQKNTSEL